MSLDYSELLLAVVKNKASDLHITAGSPPMLRVRGSLVPIEGVPSLTPTDTREFIYAILNNSQRQRLETDWQLDFAYSIPGVGRYRVNTYFQRGTIGAAFVANAKVLGVIDGESRGPKIRVFKKRRRKGIRRTRGHRSTYTCVRITEIVI